MKSYLEAPMSKDLKHVSKVILQDNQKTLQKVKKEFDKVVADKDEEICRLEDHSQILIAQIKKVEGEKWQ